MRLKQIFTLEPVSIGATTQSYFTDGLFEVSIDDEFKVVRIADPKGNEIFVSFAANVKYFTTLEEPKKEKPTKTK
jgi:hypothetical protein